MFNNNTLRLTQNEQCLAIMTLRIFLMKFQNLLKFVPGRSVYYKLSLGKVVARRRICDQPEPEPTMSQLTDVYMRPHCVNEI